MENKLILTKIQQILVILNKYNLINSFENMNEITKWVSKLNNLQINNLLSLNIDPNLIKFDTKLLINKDLLNTNDYLKRINAFISIKNAEGWYHLFDYMLNPDFLNSNKFYQDIETLKRAKCAQTPLWIIGEKTFIDSPYHDEDFDLLITATNSNEELYCKLSEVIATVISNDDSINSKHHKTDLNIIVKYGSEILQGPNSYPKASIGYLAIDKVSLNDPYHIENMELLANNSDIGNFLYPIMTNEQVINKPYYRRIIEEMIEYKNNEHYAFMLCCYTVGFEKAKLACYIDQLHLEREISRLYNIDEILKKIDEKLNTVDGNYHEITRYEIEAKDNKKKLIKLKFFNK